MSDYTELQKAAAYAAQDAIKFADEDEEIRALQQFHEEVDPETVLALIAENDLLRGAHEQICTSYNQVSYASEERGKQIDQLKAELEHTGYDHDLLRNENDQLKAENERLRADYAGLARFNPEWDRVAAAQDSVREHMAMVVQLKAEVAGLRTGYEAYERVNAELKAENERLVPFEEAYRTACNVRNRLINEGEELRKALAECGDSLQGEMLQKFGGQLPEDMHPVTRRDYDRDMAELAGYRAAIGKGEQS